MEETRRRDKLDDALLFLMGSLGVLFGLIQLYVGSGSLILFVIPVALLGWVLPFHYGYLLGAMQDSMVDRYRGWVVLVVGLGFYAVIVTEERLSSLLSSLLPDPRLEGSVAMIVLPFVFLYWKYARAFNRFVLGSTYQTNEILSESASNIGWAAFAIAIAGAVIASVRSATVSDLTIYLAIEGPLAVIAFWYVRRSNYFAQKISLHYQLVEMKGPLHDQRAARIAYRIFKVLSFLSFTSSAIPALFLDFGYSSDLLFPTVYAALGTAFLFALPTIILYFLIRTRHKIVFQT